MSNAQQCSEGCFEVPSISVRSNEQYHSDHRSRRQCQTEGRPSSIDFAVAPSFAGQAKRCPPLLAYCAFAPNGSISHNLRCRKKSSPVNDRSLPLQNLRDTDKTPSYRHHCEKHTSRLLRNCQWSLASSYHDHSQHPTDDRAKPGKNHDRFRDRLFSVALRSLNVPKGVRYGDD